MVTARRRFPIEDRLGDFRPKDLSVPQVARGQSGVDFDGSPACRLLNDKVDANPASWASRKRLQRSVGELLKRFRRTARQWSRATDVGNRLGGPIRGCEMLLHGSEHLAMLARDDSKARWNPLDPRLHNPVRATRFRNGIACAVLAQALSIAKATQIGPTCPPTSLEHPTARLVEP